MGFAAGFAASFFVDAALFAGAFLAAALARLVDDGPVTAFLAAPRLEEAVVFLVVVLALALFGFAATGFLTVGFFAVGAFGFSTSFLVVLVVEEAFLVVAALDLLTGFALVVAAVLDFEVLLEVGLFLKRCGSDI